jgi:small subunit ribosomal protein S4
MATKNPNRRNKAKFKITRRLGENLWGDTKSPVANSVTAGPGQHGARRKKLTGFGIQLREKQKLKSYYGNITERQFRNTFKEAMRRKGDTSEEMIGLLESRLDAVIYRMNITGTMFAARQFVGHKHVMVNGKVINIPSYICKAGDVITVRENTRQNVNVIDTVGKMTRAVPEYLSFDPSTLTATFVRMPKLEEVPYPVQMNPNLVVEFYSR